jgi:Rrf2 family protein
MDLNTIRAVADAGPGKVAGKMLQITRDGEYGVRAVIHLAGKTPGTLTLISEIAEAQEVPKSYLSKIMQQLVRSGLVRSRRGAKGGFELSRPAANITLRETIEAVEGAINLNICLEAPGACSRDRTCPTHPVWREAQKKLFEVLDGKTMAELAADGEKLRRKAAKCTGGASRGGRGGSGDGK